MNQFNQRRFNRQLNDQRPSFQPDEASMAAVERDMRAGMIPFDEIIKYLDQWNIPPQLRQTPYSCVLTATDTPILLIPANPNRMSFLVAGPNIDINFSYGFPIKGVTNAVPTNIFLGVGVPSAGSFQEGNGTVSIDDIYVWAEDSNSGDFPIAVLGYEGVLAVESHLHHQTKGG